MCVCFRFSHSSSSMEDLLSPDADEVDQHLTTQLQTFKSTAQKAAIAKFRKVFPSASSSEAASALSPHFQEESDKYENHARSRSRLFCEKVLQDARAFVTDRVSAGQSDTETSGIDSMEESDGKNKKAESVAKVLQVNIANLRVMVISRFGIPYTRFNIIDLLCSSSR